jgi:acetoin utilization deacetylase AcuC-like enzyme
MPRVGLIYDPVYLEHDTGNHVENSGRLTATLSVLEETEVMQKITQFSPRPASIEEIAQVHAQQYIDQVKAISERGGGSLDLDTVLSSGSNNAALMAAGGVITAVEAVMNKTLNHAFCLVRPPGHHASCWHGAGFCLFNNIAIATKYLLLHYAIERILIVDFDVHHGNGTQDTFYTDPNVLYFSTHQYPLYPGTGTLNETGKGDGLGLNINIPMAPGCGDSEYQTIYEDILAPIALRYKPQFILVSAGYDGHWSDNLASMQLSVFGFVRIAEILKVLADKLCAGNLVFTLEGGYNLQALAYSIASTINALNSSQEIHDPLGVKESAASASDFHKFVKMLQEKHDI